MIQRTDAQEITVFYVWYIPKSDGRPLRTWTKDWQHLPSLLSKQLILALLWKMNGRGVQWISGGRVCCPSLDVCRPSLDVGVVRLWRHLAWISSFYEEISLIKRVTKTLSWGFVNHPDRSAQHTCVMTVTERCSLWMSMWDIQHTDSGEQKEVWWSKKSRPENTSERVGGVRSQGQKYVRTFWGKDPEKRWTKRIQREKKWN